MKQFLVLAEVFVSLVTFLAEPDEPLQLPERAVYKLPESLAPKRVSPPELNRPNNRPPQIEERRDPFSDIFRSPAPKTPFQESPRDSRPPVLVSQKRHDLYMSFWPRSNDEWLNELKSKRIIFYDDATMPRAYQIFDGRGRDGVHNARVNFTGGRDPHGNANMEFPWASPAGFLELQGHKYDATGRFKGIRFMHLPEGKKITWWNVIDRNNPQRSLGVGWAFPEGTVFGEILLLTDTRGFDHTFEFRVREKRYDNTWSVDAFRPYRTIQDYVASVMSYKESFVSGQDEDYGDPSEEEVPIPKEFEKLQWHAHNLHSLHKAGNFIRQGWSLPLPKAPAKMALAMLDKGIFRSVRNTPFAKETDGKEVAWAPFTQHDDQIVPKNYLGSLLRVNFRSCMECHKDTDLEAAAFDSTRDWWGRVRGSDSILSFHVFDPSCVSNSGTSVQPALRKELIKAGLVRHWKEKK